MLTLDQARAFVAVAEELHFGRAAERLHMTQPPLSRQIQKLEKTLGVTLLLREPRGVSLTAAGEAFRDECHQLLEMADRAPRRAQLIASGQVGLIRLGYTAASGYSVLGPVLARIKEAVPGVTVELHEMVTAVQLEALRSGAVDLGLARPPFQLQDVNAALLLAEPLMVAVPAGHRFARRSAPVSAQELQHEAMIMYSPDQARYFSDLVADLVEIRSDQVTHTAAQILTLVALVGAGHGVALVPHSTRHLGMPGVRMLPLLESPSDAVQLHAVWLSTSTNPALHRALPHLRKPVDLEQLMH
ncbi:DNA-binding transcriptional LysR family regulator [Nocardiopsis sp. Huas11]|uniref:LysR family transcriptional regulator n=1 Tax=Nocardiopsis sp. Huas11 TaxID=2183912 RepID=UPI000EB5C801|nr:LysR family transcriptional regulator [Nocardiopsis sp. Huas11]RKS07456.1 DNA-binding transcriptional LysR family regulator [Nocardiopsis sp. Huas11]